MVLFVGINGTGKTTTVGKLAKEAADAGRTVLLGSADTFRAAAIEQLEAWARRAGVEVVTRERGSDPASVCYDTLERAEAAGADLVLIDTAGRLHTSADLMRELEKVVGVVRKRANLPVYTVLVTDATTGQNGLQQAREFDRALDLDGVIVTKLDGTAKGGIALAVSHELELPVLKIGVGEGLDDLKDFDAARLRPRPRRRVRRAGIGGFCRRRANVPREALCNATPATQRPATQCNSAIRKTFEKHSAFGMLFCVWQHRKYSEYGMIFAQAGGRAGKERACSPRNRQPSGWECRAGACSPSSRQVTLQPSGSAARG